MNCPQCGHAIQEGMLFCTACGARVREQAAESTQAYRVVFERPKRFGAMASTLIVKVDGAEKMRLANGESRELRLAHGTHRIEIGMLLCRPRSFSLEVDRERRITCYYATGKAMLLNPMVASLIVAEDERGTRL